MSLLYVEHRSELCFGIWHITEEESQLESLSGCSAPTHVTSPARRREYLAVRSLAVTLGIIPDQIDYLSSGKPFLRNDARTISISHTKDYAALLVGKQPLIGIDIEQQSKKAERVRHKYMHPTEDSMLEASGLDIPTGLLVHWCAKEAVFKAVPEEGIDFSEEIRLTRLPDVPFLSDTTVQQTASGDAAAMGEIWFMRTRTAFKLEAWSSPAFVLVICHSGISDRLA